MNIPNKIKSQAKYILGALLLIGSFIIISYVTAEADKRASISNINMYLAD